MQTSRGPGGPICCGQIHMCFSECENSSALPLRGTVDSSINQDLDEPAGLPVTSQQWDKLSSSHCISIRSRRCQPPAASVPLLPLSMFSQLFSKTDKTRQLIEVTQEEQEHNLWSAINPTNKQTFILGAGLVQSDRIISV